MFIINYIIIFPIKSLGNCRENLLIKSNENSNNYLYENKNNNFEIINNKSFFELESLKLKTYFLFLEFNYFKSLLNENFQKIENKTLITINLFERNELLYKRK